MGTLEDIINPLNLNAAYKRVKQNRGSGGVDRMTVEELPPYLKLHGGEIVRDLLGGRYRPLPVRRVEIPKDNGKMRQLGIPTAVDRMVQQAIAQVLTPMYEPQFVETSYGFRPKRSAHDAIRKCREYLNAGYVWTVDMDLEKFFDTVNQSKLLEVLSRTVRDGRVISLISKFLRAGVVKCGRFEDTEIGVPQGGPLSPLLANIMLNELDHELERRGHKFVRYADDMVIFCKSKASAEQTLKHITPFIEGKLFLKVNREKTAVAYARENKISRVWVLQWQKRLWSACACQIRRQDAGQGKGALTDRRRLRTKEAWTQSQKRFVMGWVNYFKLADMANLLQRTDEWMRRRIRMVFLKRWKKRKTRYQNLKHLGLSEDDAKKIAYSRKGYWHTALCEPMHRAISNARLLQAGFESFSTYYQSVHTA